MTPQIKDILIWKITFLDSPIRKLGFFPGLSKWKSCETQIQLKRLVLKNFIGPCTKCT